MLRIGSIVLRVDDLQRQTEFWEAALDYVRADKRSDDFELLRPRDGVGPNLSLDQVPSTVQVPPRTHLDLFTENQAEEVERPQVLVPAAATKTTARSRRNSVVVAAFLGLVLGIIAALVWEPVMRRRS